MAIPDFQSIMLPALRLTNDGKEHLLGETIKFLASEFNLTAEERKELLPSGTQAIFYNRVSWAVIYLRKAGLLESKKRGCFFITERGRKILENEPEKIDTKLLEQFPEFIEFKKAKRKPTIEIKKDKPSLEGNPEEIFEAAFQDIKDTLASDLLDMIKSCTPDFFERLVIDVLINMGYGGSRIEAGEAMGQSGDEGIDGIIKEDKLGLDIIYIQAKRWGKTTVGRPEIQKFAGALLGKTAKKGIFITTSIFSQEAEHYVRGLDAKIILIDGQRLAELMIEYSVGVSSVATYEVKKIDTDYFTEE